MSYCSKRYPRLRSIKMKELIMFSNRFQRPIIISSHAKIRMVERGISEIMLL